MSSNAKPARIGAVIAGAFLLSVSATALAQPATRRAHIDPRSGVEWAWSGTLSLPSMRAPASIAHAFAATVVPVGVNAEALAPVRTAALPGGGSLVVLQQRAGTARLRVVGGQVAVRLDAAGRVRWAASRARALPADLALVPSLTESEAAAAAGWVPGQRPGAPRFELVVHAPEGGEARLAWQVITPFDPVRREVLRTTVDAHTGRMLGRDNLVLDVGQARAFEVNPVETPGTEVVQMTGLDDGATTLTGPDYFAETCLDNDTCVDTGAGFVHFCGFGQTALADQNGDFLQYDFVSDTEPEDAFSEVQMFHHTGVALARALELGFEGLDQPIRLLTNFRTSATFDSNCDGPVYLGEEVLQPFDNAFFNPFGVGGDGTPAMLFGQGSVNDFSYDGDVVYHEFGHAVMFQIAPEVGFFRFDQYGHDSTPHGLHEGYADLMTMFVTGDPEIAEYASVNFGVDLLRNIDNDRTCPAGLVGEGHEDSEVMTGAIWAAREALPEADRAAFDQAVFLTERAFGADDDFVSAAQLTVMEVEAALGPAAAKTVAAVFTARGFDDCSTRVADAAVPHRLLFISGGYSPQSTPMPSIVQWRLTIEDTADAIQVDIAEIVDLFEGDFVEADLDVLVKPGSEPILWTMGTEEEERTTDHTLSAPFVFTEDGEGVDSGRAVVEGPFEPGEYHLQLAGREIDLRLENIAISTVAPAGAPDAGPADPDAAVDPGDDDGDNPDDGDEDGCGCRTTRPDETAGGALLLLAALWLSSRRRGVP
jgi:MYXO-CTERM domain-containing protein